MTAPLQGRTEQTIEASPARIWSILEDSSRLPEWVPLVKEVTSHESREGPGTVRRCNVQFGSKRGYMVERCVEAVPERKLVHAVDDDSLGFTKMLADYTFTLELEPEGAERTRVTCEASYEPKGPRQGHERASDASQVRRSPQADPLGPQAGRRVSLAHGRTKRSIPRARASAARRW